MTTTKQEPGVLGEAAAPLGVTRWVDASGQALEHFDLDRMPGRFKLIFCFQDACPGCHATGFPALARVVDAFRGSDFVGFAAVQTVFEDFGSNTWERMLANHSRYALGIPFGHDAGDEQDGAGSELMRRYRNGGTPWFILIDPDGRVVYNHFRIDADKLVTFLKRLENEPAAPEPGPDMLTWKGVIQLVETGNPTPPRRVERSEAEWAQQLTPEQFRITRLKGTERAHSSSMCTLFSPGIYRCVCCGTELFDASTKYDSRSGWPSFTQAIAPGLVGYHGDNSHGMVRVETTCNVWRRPPGSRVSRRTQAQRSALLHQRPGTGESMSSEKVGFAGSSQGLLVGVLERPDHAPLQALAVFAHCFTCGKNSLAATRISRALAQQGIATLRFDFTGLGESEGDFGRGGFSSSVADIVAAVHWMQSTIGMPALLVGHSLGGRRPSRRLPASTAYGRFARWAHPRRPTMCFVTSVRPSPKRMGRSRSTWAAGRSGSRRPSLKSSRPKPTRTRSRGFARPCWLCTRQVTRWWTSARHRTCSRRPDILRVSSAWTMRTICSRARPMRSMRLT